jgi:hypothetical protein
LIALVLAVVSMVRVTTVPEEPLPPFREMTPLVPFVHLMLKVVVAVRAVVSRKVTVPKLRSLGALTSQPA